MPDGMLQKYPTSRTLQFLSLAAFSRSLNPGARIVIEQVFIQQPVEASMIQCLRFVFIGLFGLAIVGSSSPPASGQSCQTSADIDDAPRAAITAAGQRYFDMAVKADAGSLRQNAVPALATDFSGVESAVKERQQDLAGAQATPKIFLLEVAGTEPMPHAEFLCGVFGKNGQTANSAAFYLDNLMPAKYAVVLFDAATPHARTNVSFILQQDGTDWKLAGFYVKPAQLAGHDSDWFSARAREYKSKGQVHNAWLYALEARNLLAPVPFMSTQATDKRDADAQSLEPTDVPANGKTVDLVAGTTTYKLTALFPATVGNDLDLIVKFQATNGDVADTNKAYAANVAVMKALVAKYPELREAFAGAVARAVDPSGHDYGTLLAMKDIR